MKKILQKQKEGKMGLDHPGYNQFGNALREDKTNKLDVSLAIHPIVIKRLAELMNIGAKKYAKWNWTGGMPYSIAWESFCRHIWQYSCGETDEDHLASAIFNLMNLMYNEEMDKLSVEEKEKKEKHWQKILSETYKLYKKE